MAKKSINNDKIVINQSFFIPDGVDNFIYEDEFIEESELDFDYVINQDDEEIIDTTFTIKIISQTLRTAPDGISTVVDVVIEVDDVNGSDNYEVRVSKE